MAVNLMMTIMPTASSSPYNPRLGAAVHQMLQQLLFTLVVGPMCVLQV